MITWDEKYVLGIEDIDEQHKRLFDIVGEAYALLKNEFYIDKYDKIIELIEELKDYTVFHFDYEEEYMKKIGYKKYFSHIVEHKDFVDKVNGLDLKKIDANQDEYILSILEFAVEWIDIHIMQKDKQIVGL